MNRWPVPAPAWHARWIAPPAALRQGPNVYFRARRHFLREDPAAGDPCVLHIAAESAFVLYVNGVLVGRGPARGTKSLSFFDSFDVTQLLRAGKNWVAIENCCPNVPTFRAAPVVPAVLLQSDDGQLATDATWDIQASPDWRRDVPLYNFQIGFMEWCDRRLEPTGWMIGRDNGNWHAAEVVGDRERLGGKTLLPRDVPPLASCLRSVTDVSLQALVPAESPVAEHAVAERMTVEPHLRRTLVPDMSRRLASGAAPLTIEPPADGSGVAFIFDFSHDVNGRFELEVEAPAGTIVDIGHEEEIVEGRLPLMHFSYRFADRYILRDGRQIVGNHFTSRGFRYVQVVLRSLSGPVRIHRVEAFDELYPYSREAGFDCSDPQLNRIWTACVRTLRLCTTDTLVDCPWRENTLYFNDMLVEAVTSLQAFGDARLIARCYRLALSQPSSTHLIPAAVPAGVIRDLDHETSIDRITLPSSCLVLSGMLEEYLLYTGDHRLVNEFEQAIGRMLETVCGWEDGEGLITSPKRYWNMIDWSYPDESLDGRCCATLNWMYVAMLNATARLSEALGWDFDSNALRRKADGLAAVVHQRFWDDQASAYVEYFDEDGRALLYSQLSAASAVLSGSVPPGRMASVARAIERQRSVVPELFMHHFICRALADQGSGQAALDRVRQFWGPIVDSGSATIWEMGVQQHGKSAFDGAGSLCHGFSTTPTSFFQQVVLGVRPTKPGFAQCTIAPLPLDLTHASGSIPTPHGFLTVSWHKLRNALHVNAVIPRGIRATLPDGRTLDAGEHGFDLPLPA